MMLTKRNTRRRTSSDFRKTRSSSMQIESKQIKQIDNVVYIV